MQETCCARPKHSATVIACICGGVQMLEAQLRSEAARPFEERSLFRLESVGMWTKLRPGVRAFLAAAAQLFELWIHTNGTWCETSCGACFSAGGLSKHMCKHCMLGACIALQRIQHGHAITKTTGIGISEITGIGISEQSEVLLRLPGTMRMRLRACWTPPEPILATASSPAQPPPGTAGRRISQSSSCRCPEMLPCAAAPVSRTSPPYLHFQVPYVAGCIQGKSLNGSMCRPWP